MNITEISFNQKAILQLLAQIEVCNTQIKKYTERGEKGDSLPIRQEKHLKYQYLKQLDEVLEDFDVHLSL